MLRVLPKEVTRWSSSVQTACDVMGMWLHRVGNKMTFGHRVWRLHTSV